VVADRPLSGPLKASAHARLVSSSLSPHNADDASATTRWASHLRWHSSKLALRKSLRVVGLFAGIGGLERGLADVGHETIMLCELDPHARVILRRHFPDVTVEDDVTTLKGLPTRTDVLVAGFPCQDLSQAGMMAGIGGRQSGLVDHVFDLLDTKRPRVPWVVLENVENMLRLDGARAMTHLINRFEALGYAWAYRVIDTRAFGLPQRRRRVFFVATRDGDPGRVLFNGNESIAWPAESPFDATASAYGFYWTEGNSGVGWAREAVPTLKGGSAFGIPSPPALWVVGASSHVAFKTPSIEDAEALQGFPRGWTTLEEPAKPGKRWRMVGNAVSVPVARWLGERLVAKDEPAMTKTVPYDRGSWPVAARGSRGKPMLRVDVSAWPVAQQRRQLLEIVETPRLLSVGAATGFYDRLDRSGLKVAPDPFRRALAEFCTALGERRTFRHNRGTS
jgi:DNA (cytosine-5)-methyltransferase 1